MSASDAGADAAIHALGSDVAHCSVHTGPRMQAEVRGFTQPVPEPSTQALMPLGLAGVGAMARRRHRA